MIRNNKEFIPVMLMPFCEDKTIDYGALEYLIEFYLEAGAKGLFANCLSSEMFELSKQEMVESVSFIVQKVNGRVPIVATGTFPGAIEQQAAFVKEIYATGIQAVIVITSLLASEHDSEEVFRSNVKQLLALTDDVPLGFYECPVPYKRVIDPTFLGELVYTGRITYHKDTSLNLANVQKKNEVTADVADFGLYDAYMAHAVATLKAGSRGLSCIQGNYFPELVVWLCNNFNDDVQQDKVDEVQQFFIDNMDVMHYAYPASAKYYLQGTYSWMGTTCRRTDIEPLDEETKIKLNELKDRYDTLKMKIFQ
ncbi:dihydrodipicolinate synthase family protein [Sphingobacterium psychroaquaticum]|uniref:dihydrodipicolinate synthase family protein n=1 Tax=Sphingobacterium psychroaquaticum TaxID=561061 RepID=UPI00106AB424|nr:dihydrodipicolinate synthase family protein [Sphingobacterium psychroaquaticum]QBQ40665.1 dihydrodipicolinate synthase family protein [Sphingobacterium psychroaquaticum]